MNFPLAGAVCLAKTGREWLTPSPAAGRSVPSTPYTAASRLPLRDRTILVWLPVFPGPTVSLPPRRRRERTRVQLWVAALRGLIQPRSRPQPQELSVLVALVHFAGRPCTTLT